MTGKECLDIVNPLKERIRQLEQELEERKCNKGLTNFEEGWRLTENERIKRGALM